MVPRPDNSECCRHYRDKHPGFADWLENNAGLAVFTLPDAHRKRMRTSNGIELQQELKRRTSKVRVFPNLASLERLSTAVLVEIDEKWETETKAYIKWGIYSPLVGF